MIFLIWLCKIYVQGNKKYPKTTEIDNWSLVRSILLGAWGVWTLKQIGGKLTMVECDIEIFYALKLLLF